MSRINQLREQRSTLARAVRNVLDQNPGKAWTAEHQKQYDDGMEEIERIDAEVVRLEHAAKLAAEDRFDDAVADAAKGKKGSKVDPTAPEVIASAWIRGGIEALNADQRQAFMNTMSTTTGNEGGYTVPTTIAAELIEALKAFGGMRQAADAFTTSSGNPMSWPSTDGTAEVGELLAENAPATGQDVSFGTVGLNVYKFGSKTFAVPFELLQDSIIDVEALIRGRAAERIGRAMNQYFTTGTGASQPRGIVTGASLGKTGTTGQTLTVIYDDLVDLEHSVDPAYRQQGCSYMMHDGSVKVIRKIKDTAGRPIFIPATSGALSGGEPAAINGYPLVVNQDVAVMAANAKSILFGALKKYKIRDVLQVSLFRFDDSAYISKAQIGFLAWARAGGNLTDSAAVKYYANSAT